MAKQRSRSTGSKEARANRTGGDEVEVSPFMFDPSQTESSGKGTSTKGGLPNVPLGQFGDAEMEFEPFMFDQGASEGNTSQGTSTDASAGGFSFEPFSVQGMNATPEGAQSTATATEPANADAFTIVGGDLPLPSYLSSGQSDAQVTEALAELPDAEMSPADEALNLGASETTTSGLKLPTGPMPALPGTDTGGLGAGRNEQMTGRTPSGPLQAVPVPSSPITPLQSAAQPPVSPVTGLGRTRGNTGPLGPLPPDRVATPNASWSDSSLASIEDFSSILIAMQAGKKLRQSTPLNESMIPQSATATLEKAPETVQTVQTATPAQTVEPVQPVEAQAVDQGFDVEPFSLGQMAPTATDAGMSPFPPLPTMGDPVDAESDMHAIPEWAVQATQSDHSTQSIAEQTDDSAAQMQDAAQDMPHIDAGWADRVAAPAEADAESPDYSWVTGQWEQNAGGMPTIQPDVEPLIQPHAEPEMQAEAEPAEPEMQAAVETPTMPDITAAADAVMAEIAASEKKLGESEPSNIEPEVAEALEAAPQMIASGSLTGDEIEFEGFMFNKGTSSPLATLPGATDEEEEMEGLHDMGPAFDPTPFTQSGGLDSSGLDSGGLGLGDDYADLDMTVINEMRREMGNTVSTPNLNENTGGLPFWLQGNANEAPTEMLSGGQERPTEPRLGSQGDTSEKRQLPSEWVGAAATPAAQNAPSDEAQDDGFGDLPPIEPFDFSLLPTNDVPESLGFNTGELSGLSPDEHDPMTVTVNLAAVADLLGGPPEAEAEQEVPYRQIRTGDLETSTAMELGLIQQKKLTGILDKEQAQQEMDALVARMAQREAERLQAEQAEQERIQAERAETERLQAEQAAQAEAEAETVISLEMPAELPSVEPDMPFEAPQAGAMFNSSDSEMEMPTLALDADAGAGYGAQMEAANEATSFVTEAEVEPEMVYEAEPVVMAEAETPMVEEYEAPMMAEAAPIMGDDVEPSMMDEEEMPMMVEAAPYDAPFDETDMMHTMPIEESYSTGGWMASATTNLTDNTLAGMTGALGTRNNPATEVDLAIDGVQVAPFDYSHLAVEDEQHTGHLEAEELQKAYGTESLAMPDEQDMIMRSRPLDDLWSEADGDASLFVHVSAPLDEEAVEAAPESDLPYAAEAEHSERYQTGLLAREDGAEEISEPEQVEQAAEEYTPVYVEAVGFAETPVEMQQAEDAQERYAAEHSESQPAWVEEPVVAEVEAAMPEPVEAEVYSTIQVDEYGYAQVDAEEAAPAYVETPQPVEPAASVEDAWRVRVEQQEPDTRAEVEQQAEETAFRARVAGTNPWMAFTETQERAMANQAAPQTQPVQPVQSAPQFRHATGPLEMDPSLQTTPNLADYELPTIENTQAPVRTPYSEGAVKMPQRGDLMTSGPLPSLEGFEDMEGLLEQYSQGIGAQMAMASAYVQAQNFDAAIRMYRKIIKKPNVSETMLRMIGDDLEDVEEAAKHLPRYYQVVGDLLLRLGRHREAIEAYNKIQ